MDPNELREGLVKAGHKKAATTAYFTTMNRYRKEVRAKYIVQFINSANGVGKSEQMALIEPEYIEACVAAEEAEEEAGVASVEYDSAKAWFEAWRTLESTKRAEMTLR